MSRRGTASVSISVSVLAAASVLVSCESGSRHSDGSVASPRVTRPGAQSVLPILGVSQPEGLALSANGDVYVVSNQGVLKYVAGATTELPLGSGSADVAVDRTERVYVADYVNGRVLTWAPGVKDPAELPFGRLKKPNAVAVDDAGGVYVADAENRVLELPPKATAPIHLPLGEIKTPFGIATDTGGNVYVTDSYNNRVLKLNKGAASATELPFGGVKGPTGITVDSASAVYVAYYGNGGKVRKLAAGAASATELPFTGLQKPWGITVDNIGSVYVADHGRNQVLKLTMH